MKGSFILSINDHLEIRATFAGFTAEAVETTYSVTREGTSKVGELIIASGQADA